MARTRVRVIAAVAATVTVVGGVAFLPSVVQADQTTPVGTPYVHEYPTAVGGDEPIITAMAAGQNGRPWFVTADGIVGSVSAAGVTTTNPVALGDDFEGLVKASDGALWTADTSNDTAYRIAPDGTVTNYPIGIGAVSIAATPDGSVWFLDGSSPTIARVTSAGTVSSSTDTTSGAPTAGGSGQQSLVVAPDGNLWFAPTSAAQLVRMTPSGTFSHVAVSGIASTLVVGSDNNIWAGIQAGGVDRVVPGTGSDTNFRPGGASGLIQSAVLGSDGRIWLAEQLSDSSYVSAVTTTGSWSRYALPNSGTMLPFGLTNAPDGSIWFDRYDASGNPANPSPDTAARITTTGSLTVLPVSSPIYAMTSAAGSVWFGEQSGGVVQSAGTLVDRISGSDRYATSVSLAQAAYPSSTGGTVYVATGTNYPDALAAGPAAAKAGGPLLLTDPSNLPDVVARELTSLDPAHVVVVGGTAAVSGHVADQIQAAAPHASVSRIAGADRFDTARQIDAVFGRSQNAYVATGTNYPDALAAAAAAGAKGVPVVLVNGSASAVDPSTTAFLSSLGVSRVTVVGGTSAVSQGISDGLGATFGQANVSRIAGTDRFDTAAKIAASAFSSASHVYLATGTAFPDALAGSALAASKNAPLLTTQGSCLPTGTVNEIGLLGASNVTIIGGTAAVSQNVAALNTCG